MNHAVPETVFESLVEVANFPQFIFDPARFDFLLQSAEGCCREIIILERFERSLRRQHSALDREMNPLQPLRVQESRGVAKNHPTITCNRRNRPPPTVRQRLRTVANHLSAFKQLGHKRMPFQLLQHALRIKARIGIIEASNEAERNDIIFAAVNPRAAVFSRGKRPAHGVYHFTGRNPARGHFPQFLNSLTIGLRITVFHQIESLNELLSQ